MNALGLLTFPAVIGIAIWRGYVLSILWGWFVVSTFGVAALSIPAAIGIAMIVGLLTANYRVEPNGEDWEVVAVRFITATLHPAFALFWGWVITFFM